MLDAVELRKAIYDIGFMTLTMSPNIHQMLIPTIASIKQWFKECQQGRNISEQLLLSYWQPRNVFLGYNNLMLGRNPQQTQQFFFPRSFIDDDMFPFANNANVKSVLRSMIVECEQIFDKIWHEMNTNSKFKQHLKTILGGYPSIQLGINFYDPKNQMSSSGSKPSVFGLNEHSDFGFITLLFCDRISGLQIYYNEQWMDIDVEYESEPLFVINFGRALEKTTNGKFKAGLHRVQRIMDRERVSIGIFLDPNHDGYIYKYDEENDRLVAEMKYREYIQQLLRNFY